MTINPPMTPTYSKWPFRKDLENGRTNIGAIDLTKEPDRIDEIHELKHTPKLKTAIYNLNKENTAAMTLGCLIEKNPEKENSWVAYLEFCFRPHVDISTVDVETLDEQFLSYFALNFSQEHADYLRSFLVWETFPVTLYDNNPSHAYSLFLFVQRPENFEEIYVPLIHWLHTDFLHLA